MRMMKMCSPNLTSQAYVFPYGIMQGKNGVPKVDWYKKLEQNVVRTRLKEVVERNPELPVGISLHSMRRGGAFYRVFLSPERRFNFRELMAWCRWSDAKTCIEYLVTKSISDEINPKNLLRIQKINNVGFFSKGMSANGMDAEKISDAIIEKLSKMSKLSLLESKSNTNTVPKHTQQIKMSTFLSISSIPTAMSAKEAWDQWFIGDAENGLFTPIKKFSKEMIKQDRKKFCERRILSLAFQKYNSYEMFEASYVGFTSSYKCILSEVRKRKKQNSL